MSQTRRPVALIIRDGWGLNPLPEHDAFNAVKQARKPCEDALRKRYPVTRLAAAGLDVGVPAGVMGNSEVGHQNIGAGRVVDQEIVRLNRLFEEGGLKQNQAWQGAVARVRENDSARLHLFGIVSDAGVHGLLEHLYGMLRMAAAESLHGRVFIHAFTDGRDTSPTGGREYLAQVEAACREIGIGEIATVCGRFWSMDRDNRWERVQKAYDCLTGRGAERTASSAVEAVEHYYQNPIDANRKGDEFVVPTWIVGEDGKPKAVVRDGDAVVFYNFRGDRPRELTKAFVLDDFDGFDRGDKLDLYYATMTAYEAGLPVEVLLSKPPKMKNILGEWVSNQGVAQFRCAETEKYPHVTFFFNDYREEPFDLEDRALIPSPKVSTYDQQPEMSAPGVIEAAKAAILSKKYGLLVINFANPDMVGHTGSLEATIKAVETVDAGVQELLGALDSVGGCAVVTADHGNAEQMWAPEIDGPHTAHTLNLVEAFVVGRGCEDLKLRDGGRLADIAPTLLQLMDLPRPEEMTGRSLIV
ncbi:MAG: 2,3-bisphosphoglycerate-independent phosphoglycerate mutase [Puniceicoccaceae bacterium]|nr:MAG: 2,3-bisphosphoglycerate-independent phosphoglycerate mutase [Puniceicoccaceae bacterium]